MLVRIIISLSLFVSFSFAGFEYVKVGHIDKEFQNIVSKQELKKMILDIEKAFESKLGMNIFDYSETMGKEINLVYRSSKTKTKAKTFVNNDLMLRTYYIGNETIQKRIVKYSVVRIEIYEFKSLNDLELIITNEINHLIGAPKLNQKSSII